MKKYVILLILALLAVSAVSAGAEEYNPVADSSAVVLCGNARFTVLTDRLIRMEWSEDGIFEDNATLAIVNRRLPVPHFSVKRSETALTLRTDRLTLVYRGGEFTRDNLSVSFRMNGKTVSWHPGADESGNLMGTTRTLDGCHGFSKISSRDNYMEKGVLSRDGWAIIDESSRHLLVKDGSDWGEWVAERPQGRRSDLYIFAYGHDYPGALSDFTKVAGKIPLPPRYTLGYWWSRYWAYTAEELLEIGSQMRSRGIPMDVFIIDMDWHETWKERARRLGKDEFGQNPGWTGYTWNGDLIPDPEGLLNELHSMRYKLALNLHPASGIRPSESCYNAFIEDYLSRTDDYDGPEGYVFPEGGYTYAGYDKPVGKAGYRAPSAFRLSQQAWADAYFNSVIRPFEKIGVDFWWIDWQQWKEDRYCKGLSETFWCNYAFFNDKARRARVQGGDARRPFIYHRWGGLGSHRYQLGFSGDTFCEWSVLEFLPYFTATASNVCYGYWGHDIGGHMNAEPGPTDPEMYTRWLQYGVFTPIFKTHSTASKDLDRRIWSYPTHYEYMRDAILLRYELSPYIYDAARYSYDSGVSMTRPLYYYYPEDDRAYSYNREFFFGDNILATVLCAPAGPDGKTECTMWFPAGNDWFDMAHHNMIKGGTVRTLSYGISENPWYVRAGAIIPLAGKGITDLQTPGNEWRIMIAPGNGESSYVHYEDDGLTNSYDTEYATTLITSRASSRRTVVTVAPRCGSYRGMDAGRKLSVIFEGIGGTPSSVTVNGEAATAVQEGTATVVDVPLLPADREIRVELIR